MDRGVDSEVQGGRVHTLTHRVGLSGQKCADLMIGIWWVLTQWKPARRVVERVVGKLGHCQTFRPALRGSFGTIYGWLHDLRERRIGRSALPAVCWWELMEASLLALLAQMELSAPWAPTVQCTDAAPGGHGLAYAQAPVPEIQRWVRYCSFRGDYTTLKEDGELYPGPGRCHLVVANLPLKDYHWHEVSRPGGFRHISEEEFVASNWGLERRLHSPGHFGTRCQEGGDNTTAVGAAVKGAQQLPCFAQALPPPHGHRSRGQLDRFPLLRGERPQPGRPAIPRTRSWATCSSSSSAASGDLPAPLFRAA